ncbi:hypothetical protein [Pyruvatibacter sp.]|uniref:GAF domain-containing protein n=1 Tax=Pyruvatibacter sp. TaxID=1981328 RepID=UPI0032EC68CD
MIDAERGIHPPGASVARYAGVMADRIELMQRFVDGLWPEAERLGWSWIGFYEIAPAGDEMTLGPCRDRPACSPIALTGMCGRSWRERVGLLIPDVHAHGDAHIVCDPRNLSEMVIPLFGVSGDASWGVFDADSFEKDRFSRGDVERINAALVEHGLTRASAFERVLTL